MKRYAHAAGFTVVEVMIVLAVTGGLFLAIAATMTGRQRSNEFVQAVQDVRAQIQQTISEVQSGYYTNDQNLSCTAGGSGPFLSATPVDRGSNVDCLYLGNVMQFAIKDTDPQEYRVYSVVGVRSGTDLASAQPKLLTDPSGTDNGKSFTLKYGLKAVAMRAGPSNAGAFAVLSSLDDASSDSSGTQQIDVYSLTPSMLNAPLGGLVGQINSALGSPTKNPAGGIRICFEGGSKQFGLVTIGGSGRQLSVDLRIMTLSNCGI